MDSLRLMSYNQDNNSNTESIYYGVYRRTIHELQNRYASGFIPDKDVVIILTSLFYLNCICNILDTLYLGDLDMSEWLVPFEERSLKMQILKMYDDLVSTLWLDDQLDPKKLAILNTLIKKHGIILI